MADDTTGLLDELRRQQEELLQTKKMLETLLASPGWAAYRDILSASIQAHRRGEFDRELVTMDAAFASATMRGKIAGLQIALATPEAHLLDLTFDLENLRTIITEAQE